MRKWDEKSTSVLAAWVDQLKEGNTHRGSSAEVKLVSASHDQAVRYYRSEDDLSDPLEGTSTVYAQEENDNQS